MTKRSWNSWRALTPGSTDVTIVSLDLEGWGRAAGKSKVRTMELRSLVLGTDEDEDVVFVVFVVSILVVLEFDDDESLFVEV